LHNEQGYCARLNGWLVCPEPSAATGVPVNNGLDQVWMDIYLKPFARAAFLLLATVFNIAALQIASRSRARLVKETDDVGKQPSQAAAPAEVEHPK
jgi:ribose transport system permease protein